MNRGWSLGMMPWMMMAVLMASHPATGEPLTVAAASSLQPAFEPLSRLFRSKTGAEIVMVAGASGNLAQQVEHGAPYDVMLSADEKWIRHLANKDLIVPGTEAVYALGRLALVVRPGLAWPKTMVPLDGAGLGRIKDLTILAFALANPNHAPYGSAARTALQKANLWQELLKHLVFGENVRQALHFVETGNADAGLVAETVARSSKLQWVPLATTLHDSLRQMLAILRHGEQNQMSERFIRLILSRPGQIILNRIGLSSYDRQPEGKTK